MDTSRPLSTQVQLNQPGTGLVGKLHGHCRGFAHPNEVTVMKLKKAAVPLAVLAFGLATPFSAAGQEGQRHHNRQNEDRERRDDGERGADDRAVARRSDSNRPARTDRSNESGGDERASRASRDEPAARPASQPRSDRDDRSYRNDRNDRDARNYRNDRRDRGVRYDRGYDRRSDGGNSYRGNWSRGYNGYSRGYYAPRPLSRAYAPRRYYGPRGGLTLYFGSGSGYRYGSYYSGRVYGDRRGVPTYGRYVSYGDLRLRDFPRDAEVYVDGYYAGIVDDFDGLFQRLTLEVGPHEIEVADGRYGSQLFDVYVDPYNTIDLRADRYR